MQGAESITLSATVLVWIGGLLIAMVGGIGTICAHILLGIHKDLRDMRKDFSNGEKAAAVKEVEIEARMRVLERHDLRNAEEMALLRRWESAQVKP